MTDAPYRYPPLTDDLKRGLSVQWLGYFGAGAIIASVSIGSGETLFASRCGAIFGYQLLWCFVAAAVMKGVQVYSAARYIVLTGEHPMTHWAYLPGPRNWVPLTIGVLSLICFPLWLAALPLVLGNIMNWVLHIDGSPEQLLLYSRLWGTLAIAIVVALTLLQTYDWLERTQTAIVGLLLVCMFIAAIASHPDWSATLAGLVTPRVPKYPEWIASTYPAIASRPTWVETVTYLGALGGGTYDYVGYIGCFREKSWGAIGTRCDRYRVTSSTDGTAPIQSPLAIDESPENVRRGLRWLLPVQVDTTIAIVTVCVFAICFVVLGARTLNPQHLVPDGNDLLSHQAQFLTRLHPALLYVYQLGIFMAFFGTIFGAYEIYFRTAFECVMPVSRRLRKIKFNKFRIVMLFYCAFFGLIFLWSMDNPVKMITPAAIVGGVFSCGLWCLAMLWTDRRFLPAPLRMKWPLASMVWVSGVVLTLLGSKAIYDYIAELLVA